MKTSLAKEKVACLRSQRLHKQFSNFALKYLREKIKKSLRNLFVCSFRAQVESFKLKK